MTRAGILAATFALFAGLFFLLLGLTLARSAPTASAQVQFVQPAGDTPGAASPDRSQDSYSEDELRSFAEAALEVKRIKETYIPQIAAAASEQEEEELKAVATKEMTQAVEQRGLKVDRYQEILVAVLTRPELAHRVGKFMNNQSRDWVNLPRRSTVPLMAA